MKFYRVPPLVLAAVLEVLPLARVAVLFQRQASPLWAIIFRWAGSAAAALGGIQAVSGASTVITSPLTAKGTNGIPFKLRLTSAPDQAHYWTASGLPSGITLQGTSGQTFWQIAGTPTAPGTFNVRLTAKDQINSGADRTVSATLVMTIVGTATAPAIATQPQSQTVLAGSSVTFTVSASGTAPLSYQWKKNNQDIAGGTTATLSLSNVSVNDAGSYAVLVSNSAGSALSQSATLTVNVPATPPIIASNPASVTAIAGSSATFTVSATGTAPLSYQWKKNDQDIAGATAATLSLSNVSVNDAGSYAVLVSNSAGSALSQSATLTVIEPATAPAITVNPLPATVHAGQTVSFSVTASGSGTLSYKWFLGDQQIPGAAGSILSLNNVTASAAGSYSVEVSNSAGATRSSAASLEVKPLQITSCVESGAACVLTWSAIPGTSYSVEGTGALAGAWQVETAGPVQANGGSMTVSIARAAGPNHFYRIRTAP